MERIKLIAEEISRLVPKFIRGIHKGRFRDLKLTHSQITILLEIYERKTAKAGELSRSVHVSAPTITGLIDRLLRNGYLKRTRDKNDRRVVNIELTSKGKKTVENLITEIKRRWSGILVYLTAEERENYVKILRRIVEVLTKENA